jgi:hypothetical protein
MNEETYIDKVSGRTLYVERLLGSTRYYKDKAMTIAHREDGPAIVYNGGVETWMRNGFVHRMDGPAYVPRKNPYSVPTWYINGVNISRSVLRVKLTDLQKL